MSLENVDEYEADIRRRNLVHLKREESRLFDASSIAKRFRLTDRRTSRENASGSRDSVDDQVAGENQARRLEQSRRVEENQDKCTSGELVCDGLENNSEKTLQFKLLDALRRCSLVTKADHAGSGPLEVSFSGVVEGEVQYDALKDVGGQLGSPAVQSPIVRCMSDDDADDGIEHTCQVETPSNNNVHRQILKMCHTVTSQLFSGQDSPGTGHRVDANLDMQFCKDGAENLGNDTPGNNDRVEILSDSNYAGRHLSEKDKHLSSNQGQSVEESMVDKQPVPSIVDYCTTIYDGIEMICRKSFQSPVRHYSMRPWSSEKKRQYSSRQPVRHYSMRPRCSEKKIQYSSPQPVRHYSMRPRCSEKKQQYSSSRTLGGRRKLQWTLEEVRILEEGVHKLSSTNDKSTPWKEILKYGSDVFKSRTTVDLKDKWRNICKGKSKLG